MWETSQNRALIHLPHVFVVHLTNASLGLCPDERRVSSWDMSILTVRRHSWVDRTRAQPRDLTRDMVRMRQFSTFWTRPHHDSTRSDVSRFRGFCDLVKFELRLCTCVFRSRCVRPSVQRQARRDVVLWNEIGVSAAEMNMRL